MKQTFILFLLYALFTIPKSLSAQLKPYQKNYFAESNHWMTNTTFPVFGLYTDSIVQHDSILEAKLAYIPGPWDTAWDKPDTAIHPFGRKLIFAASNEIYVTNQYFDTIRIPTYTGVADIHFKFKNQQRYFIRKSGVTATKLPELQTDSIAYWDLYMDSAGNEILKCPEWIGIGQNHGLCLFHNLNQPDSINNFYFRLHYRRADPKRIWNYQPGDWLEYTYWCDGFSNPNGPYLSGPEDYMLIEILNRYNDSQYQVKTTFLNRTPGNMTINEDTTVSVIDKSPDLCQCDLRLLYGFQDLAPGNLYGGHGWYYTSEDIYYDSSNKRYHYSNNHDETPSFEPRYDGSYSVEDIGVLNVYYSDNNSQTHRCKSLTGVHIAGVLDYGTSRISLNTPANTKIALLPNPAIQFIQIAGIKSVAVNIYDIRGNCIIKNQKSIDGRIDISELSDGIYFLSLNGTGFLRVKFIKLTR